MNVDENGVYCTEHIEHIAWNGKPLAYIIRAGRDESAKNHLPHTARI